MYKPAELAEEIKISVDTIYRSYIPAGMPHIRKDNEIWINGLQFVEWAKHTIAKNKKDRKPLPENVTWCLKCNKIVPLISPYVAYQNHYIEILQSICPDCGTRINRGRRREK